MRSCVVMWLESIWTYSWKNVINLITNIEFLRIHLKEKSAGIFDVIWWSRNPSQRDVIAMMTARCDTIQVGSLLSNDSFVFICPWFIYRLSFNLPNIPVMCCVMWAMKRRCERNREWWQHTLKETRKKMEKKTTTKRRRGRKEGGAWRSRRRRRSWRGIGRRIKRGVIEGLCLDVNYSTFL